MVPVTFALVLTAGAALATGCSGENPYQAAKNATTTTVAESTNDGSATGGSVVGDNPFLPDRNISDCVGTMERPDCGSPEKGTKGTYFTFAALILGLGFIFWRISIGVRKRDAVMNAEPEPQEQPEDDHAPRS